MTVCVQVEDGGSGGKARGCLMTTVQDGAGGDELHRWVWELAPVRSLRTRRVYHANLTRLSYVAFSHGFFRRFHTDFSHGFFTWNAMVSPTMNGW